MKTGRFLLAVLLSCLLLSCRPTGIAGPTPDAFESAQTEERAVDSDVEKKLEALLHRFRDEHRLSDTGLARLLVKHTGPGFTNAWFKKGGVVLGDSTYQSAYHGDRNLVSLKPGVGDRWKEVDLGPRHASVLAVVSKGRILGSMTWPADAALRDVGFLLFEPSAVHRFYGKEISGESFPRTPKASSASASTANER
ncbi:hypothetical protein OOT46_16865 [Aquabacterium sp. A7-Y]|uniref:hypothetical protein n=1 Tax=Aquabacterium sp. A7-Y TaxID=1349605 RepID=UPI00223CD31C|nr:hypothetical protein [Aquabacterium sp. A7-Y]MCW7539516.1 hypothetical protein [Aquabacterium sp. A7-Y]